MNRPKSTGIDRRALWAAQWENVLRLARALGLRYDPCCVRGYVDCRYRLIERVARAMQ